MLRYSIYIFFTSQIIFLFLVCSTNRYHYSTGVKRAKNNNTCQRNKKSSTADWQEMNPLHFGLLPHIKTKKTSHHKFQAISAQKEWHCVTEEEVHEMT